MSRAGETAAWLYPVGRALCWLAIRLVFRWRVVGRENLPAGGPVILCANHRSYWDPPVVGVASHPRVVHFMAKEELFRVPVLAAVFRAVGAFPVKRGAADLGSLRRAMVLLKAGRAVGVFLEGGRVKSGDLGEGQPGAVYLAAATGAPIVPVAIQGSMRPFSRLVVRIGAPIDVRAYLPDGRQRSREMAEVANAVVMRRIRELLSESA